MAETKDSSQEKISLELGGGGKMMRDFIAEHIVANFGNPFLEPLADSAYLPGDIAFTTDSYVVMPIFFPGGDIGSLCVNGTVNDLVVAGAEPKFLSLAFILEEGMPLDELKTILRSIRSSAEEAGVSIVTGDTKTVRRGQGDKIFINTAGIGFRVGRPDLSRIQPGDKIILTGTLGDHSLAVMVARGEFGLESDIRSDCAPLNYLLPFWNDGTLWMRDVTRGGLATVLSELAEKLSHAVLIDEGSVPLSDAVRGATEILGIDPLFLACEGRAVLVVPEKKADSILQRIRNHAYGRTAAVIGEVSPTVGRAGEVLLSTLSGGLRLLEPLTSELLPRIC